MDDLRKPDVVTVLVSRADGGVTLLRVVTAEYRPATEAEIAEGSGPRVMSWSVEPTPEHIDSVIAKHNWPPHLQAVSWEIVPNDFVTDQTDRTFRNAWKANSGRIDVDMPKAREIHRQRLRRARAPLLEELDVEYQRADETNDAQGKRRVAEEKQRLRDVTADPRIGAAETPEQLKAVWPLT